MRAASPLVGFGSSPPDLAILEIMRFTINLVTREARHF
jgi:hypothetical protein